MKSEFGSLLSSTVFASIVDEFRHPKSRKAVEHVRDACDYLDEHRIPIDIPEIARLCGAQGPRAQSIRSSRKLMSYVNARKSEQRLPIEPSAATLGYASGDPQADAQVYALATQMKRERTQKESLKRALQGLGDFDLAATMRTGRLVRFREQQTPGIDAFAGLVRRLLDPIHLQRFGLTIASDRVIAINRNNRVFIERNDLETLKAVIAATQRSDGPTGSGST